MKTNKLLNPISLFFVGLFLGALSRLFDMYDPNLGEIFLRCRFGFCWGR